MPPVGGPGYPMQDHPLLAHVVLGYSAVIDRQRAVAATRLTVAPESAGATVDGAALMQVLAEVWPEAAGALSLRLQPVNAKAGSSPTAGVSLLVNAAGESLLRSLLDAPAVPRFMIEVPAFMAADPVVAASVRALHETGGTLALKGQPREPLPADVASAFTLQIEDADAPAPKGSALPRLRHGTRSSADHDAWGWGRCRLMCSASTLGRLSAGWAGSLIGGCSGMAVDEGATRQQQPGWAARPSCAAMICSRRCRRVASPCARAARGGGSPSRISRRWAVSSGPGSRPASPAAPPDGRPGPAPWRPWRCAAGQPLPGLG